jgi:hypothetical protein
MLADPHFQAREAIVRVPHPEFDISYAERFPGSESPGSVAGPGRRSRAQRRGLRRLRDSNRTTELADVAPSDWTALPVNLADIESAHARIRPHPPNAGPRQSDARCAGRCKLFKCGNLQRGAFKMRGRSTR